MSQSGIMRRCAFATYILCVAEAHAEQPFDNDPKHETASNEEFDDSNAPEGETIVIEAEVPYLPVAAKSVRDRDFLLRPHPRPADILRATPGIFVNQHAGGGKANQFFLRGFDADHGTDIALSFDGIPINMVSHGHGQGYADLNWIIPELVTSLDISKGPHSALRGDFANAGAINMVSREVADQTSLSMTAASFSTMRLLGIASPQLGTWRTLLAAEAYGSNGPFRSPEGYLRYNTYAKVGHDLGATGYLSLAATSYAGKWNASGQLPEREVDTGRLDEFGALDASDGGRSERHSVYALYDANPDDDSEIHAMAYLATYRLALFSNFTFYLEDPVNGDQIEQTDDRMYAGISTRYRFRRRLRETPFVTTVGLQLRSDQIDNALYTTRARQRMTTTTNAEIKQTSAALFAQEDVRWASWLRTVVGTRLDVFSFDVDSSMQAPATQTSALVSPKASMVVSPAPTTDLYLNAGLGFHSNDARAVVDSENPGTPLARSVGYEVGARTRLWDRLDLAGSLWGLDIEDEIVWVGDAGTTETRGPTRRLGVELESRLQVRDWLFADTDVTLSRARFTDLPEDANRVPLAPRYTLSAGVSAQHPAGLFGRLGARSLSDRPLTEDAFLVAEGFTLLDLSTGYRTPSYEVSIAIDNALNARWREAQFATTSRLATDPALMAPPPQNACPATTRTQTTEAGNFAGCEDVHFTPGAPFNAMLTLRIFM